MFNSYVIHSGVKGMRWGIRKKLKPSAKNMPTKDLSRKVNRMKLEQDYNKLTNPKKARAKMIGAAVLTAIATTSVTMAVRRYGGRGMDAIDNLKKPVSNVAETIWDLPLSDWVEAAK